jgi:DNA-binding NarL/FixJ family response regulator
MRTIAKQEALRALVEDLTVTELARLVDLEVEELVRMVVAQGSARGMPDWDAAPTDRGQSPALRGLSPEALVDRLTQIGGLEGRQRDVARLLLLGESDRAIADRLGCSERTAKRAVAELLARFGMSNRASLMVVLFRDAGTI